jgi:hypothetical protein
VFSKEIADQFINKIEKIIDNQDYLNNISINARKYYEDNCTVDYIVNNFFKIVNLNLLK